MDDLTELPEKPRRTRGSALDRKALEIALKELQSLAHDPKLFFERRGALLDQYMNSLGPTRREASTRQQTNIDHLRAVSGTPQRALDLLLSDLTNHLNALDRIHLKLKETELSAR